MVIVLRFEHSDLSAPIDFYDDEVVPHIWKNELSEKVWLLETGTFTSLRTSSGKERLIVTFRRKYGDRQTTDKLESLHDLVDSNRQAEVLTCRYGYAINQDSILRCQMKRDDMRWDYTEGKENADATVTINFHGASTGQKAIQIKTVAR